jgi:hypothetical protein
LGYWAPWLPPFAGLQAGEKHRKQPREALERGFIHAENVPCQHPRCATRGSLDSDDLGLRAGNKLGSVCAAQKVSSTYTFILVAGHHAVHP